MLKLVVIQIVVSFFRQFTVMCCIPDICRQRHQHVCGEKICHVEKFLHTVMWKFFHVTNYHGEKALHMRNVKQLCNVEK